MNTQQTKELRLEISPQAKPIAKETIMALLEGRKTKPLAQEFEYTTDEPAAKALNIPTTGTIKIDLIEAEREDGSGESWNLMGYPQNVNAWGFSGQVSIYTRTDRSTGVITFKK